jgi:hypothetical protein
VDAFGRQADIVPGHGHRAGLAYQGSCDPRAGTGLVRLWYEGVGAGGLLSAGGLEAGGYPLGQRVPEVRTG